MLASPSVKFRLNKISPVRLFKCTVTRSMISTLSLSLLSCLENVSVYILFRIPRENKGYGISSSQHAAWLKTTEIDHFALLSLSHWLRISRSLLETLSGLYVSLLCKCPCFGTLTSFSPSAEQSVTQPSLLLAAPCSLPRKLPFASRKQNYDGAMTCTFKRLALLGSLCAASSFAAQLPRPVLRQVSIGDIDGTYGSEYERGSCPGTLVVESTALVATNNNLAETPLSSISVDGNACTGTGSLHVVTSEVAQNPSQLNSLGFPDVTASIGRNTAANTTLNGGFDQATMYVGFFDEATTCGTYTFGADAFLFFLATDASTQDITITTAAGAETTTIPANSNGLFLVDGSSLCVSTDTAVAQRPIDPALIPLGTPGSTSSIFDEEVPLEFGRPLTEPVDNTTTGQEACFPGSATVEVAGGYKVPVSSLVIGDSVKTGVDTFSEVILFTHRETSSINDFVSIVTESGDTISLSGNHYLHVTALGRLVPASEVKPGDYLVLGNSGRSTAVVRTEAIRREGLYNPQTIDGNIVVENIVASTYTTAIHPRLAHVALLAPVRWLYKMPFSSTRSFLGSLFENGNSFAAALLPSGPSLVSI